MSSVPGPDYRLTGPALADFLRFFSTASGGGFSATLFKETGQGYNLVLHAGGATPKVRLALVKDPSDPTCAASSSYNVRDIIAQVLTEDGKFSKTTDETLDYTLNMGFGCVRLSVENGVVVKSDFHNGELWP